MLAFQLTRKQGVDTQTTNMQPIHFVNIDLCSLRLLKVGLGVMVGGVWGLGVSYHDFNFFWTQASFAIGFVCVQNNLPQKLINVGT